MERETASKIGAAIGVCGAVLGLAVLPLALKTQAAAEPAVEEFYARYNRQDFGGALSAVAAEASGGKRVEDLQSHYARLGAYRGRRMLSFKTKDFSGRRLFFRYRADYEKGSSDDIFRLVKDNGRYRLVNYPGDCPND